VGRADLGEWIDPVEGGAEPTGLEERKGSFPKGPGHRDLLLQRAGAEHRPDQGEALAEQEPEIEFGASAGYEPHHRRPSARGEGAEVTGEVGTADQIEDRLDADAPGLAEHLVDKYLTR
jgi:hypothetical protein